MLTSISTSTAKQSTYDLHKDEINKWINKHIHSLNNDLVTYLFNNDLVPPNTINNYSKYDEDEVEDVQQEVLQWYVVSDIAYEQLTKIGDVTFEWKGVYIWGRTCFGQALELDYYYQQNKILQLLNKN